MGLFKDDDGSAYLLSEDVSASVATSLMYAALSLF
jgi:hypothetical protein